jgi:hypothetical protein
VSQLSQYPDDITNTIRELAKLESHESMDSDALKCIFYVLSFYNGWFLGDGIVMREVLENEGFDYDEFGLISPEEHESIATKGYNLDLFFDVHGELEEKPEIYGCSVTVKFSNGKQYKYNCKNDEVEEDDVVCVSGKLMNQQGTVIDRSEIWNSAEYMEEVTAIVEEETESGEEDDKEDNDKSFFGSLFGNTVNGKK